MKRVISVVLALVTAAFMMASAFGVSAADAHDFIKIREAKLAAEIEKNKIPTAAFSDQGEDGKNSNTRLTKSPVGITESQMFRVTRTTGDTDADNSQRRMATIYTDRKTSVNAEAYMYYLELPEDLDEPIIEISWNLYDGKSETQQNGHIYNGTAYYLAEGSKTWVPTTISNRFFELEPGFKGYVLLKPTECADIGTKFDKNWQLQTTHVYIHDLNNQTVLVSRPFIVEHIGDMGFAGYVGDDTANIKDLFSGDTLSAEEAVYEMKIGEKLYSLPVATADFTPEVPDLTYLPTKVTVEWEAQSGAASYSARLFIMNSTEVGKSYTYEKEAVVTEPKATFEALTENARYYVVVYALDKDGKEIAVSDSVNIYAMRGINFDKADKADAPSTTLIIIIAAVAVVVIAAAVVIVILLTKKKK